MKRIIIGLAIMGVSVASYLGYIAYNPGFTPLVVAFIVGLLIAGQGFVAVTYDPPVQKDPQRMFTATQRTTGFARAGGRCELEVLPFIRCSRSPSHGDHYIPWSKGGATTMGNFVAACRSCNLRKSDSVPSAFATWRLERRRKKYFPDGVPVRVGERAQQSASWAR